MMLRRLRGALLRLTRRRLLAIAVGAALLAPAAWIEMTGAVGGWWVDGVCLIVGATGAALLWTGITGVRPDWNEGR
jgi:hypothetical protein